MNEAVYFKEVITSNFLFSSRLKNLRGLVIKVVNHLLSTAFFIFCGIAVVFEFIIVE